MKEFIKYVGMDVHKETIAVSVAPSDAAEVRFVGEIANTAQAIEKLVKQLRRDGADLKFCYEAGPCGYGIHRQLMELGWECQVVAPSLIPKKAGDRVKTDRRDSLSLARLHRAGELTAVWVAAPTAKPVLHGDNGSTLKATTVLAMLNWLGVKPSYSRPRVSDDNAYAESLFRTAKYRPEFPAKGFADLEMARAWAAGFVHWYNVEHRHSGIRYVSPAQRHTGQDHDILVARHALYTKSRELNPSRWSGKTRDWSPIGAVTLNPERDSIIRAHSGDSHIQQLAA